VARQCLFSNPHNAEAGQYLDVARDRASVPLQSPGEARDRIRLILYFPKEEDPLLGEHVQEGFEVLEGEHSAGRYRAASIRPLRKSAPAFKERFRAFYPDFTFSHV
jgi:hypothetical protein